MRTDNFKIKFELTGSDGRLTTITFGYTILYVLLLSDRPLEHFQFTYVNAGRTRFCITTFDLPDMYRIAVSNLYYGFFAYDRTPFFRSPALECISVIRSIMNYYARRGIRLV